MTELPDDLGQPWEAEEQSGGGWGICIPNRVLGELTESQAKIGAAAPEMAEMLIEALKSGRHGNSLTPGPEFGRVECRSQKGKRCDCWHQGAILALNKAGIPVDGLSVD